MSLHFPFGAHANRSAVNAKLLVGVLWLASGFSGLFALELPDTAGKQLDTGQAAAKPPPNESVDNIAREIRKHNQWRILDWKPKLLEQKTVYQFKLLDRKRGRVQVIEVDPARPQLESLGDH